MADIVKDPKDWHGYVETGGGLASVLLNKGGLSSEGKALAKTEQTLGQTIEKTEQAAAKLERTVSTEAKQVTGNAKPPAGGEIPAETRPHVDPTVESSRTGGEVASPKGETPGGAHQPENDLAKQPTDQSAPKTPPNSDAGNGAGGKEGANHPDTPTGQPNTGAGERKPTDEIGRWEGEGGSVVDQGAKRGPKTDPASPHNAKIQEVAKKLEDDGNIIVAAGGGRKEGETLIDTPGGVKEGRRPDIIYETPDGQTKAINVGKTKADGTPVKREGEALKDLNGPGNLPTDFVPYDR